MKSPILCCLDSCATDNGSLYGRFLLGPFPIDLSLTVATTLRRGLLHSQPSFGIVSAEIEGAVHEYASLPGVQESVLELLLNLGEVVLTTTHRNLLERSFRNTGLLGSGIYIASLRFSGPGFVKAKDINWPDGIYCVNPNAHIATLSNNETLAMRIKIVAAFTDQTTSFCCPDFAKVLAKQARGSLLGNKNQNLPGAVIKANTAIKSSTRDTLSLGKKTKDNLLHHVLQSKKQNKEPHKIDFEGNSVTIFTSSENPNSTSITKTSRDSQTNKIQDNLSIKTLRSGLSSPTLFAIQQKLSNNTLTCLLTGLTVSSLLLRTPLRSTASTASSKKSKYSKAVRSKQRPSFGKKQNKNDSVYQSSDRTFLQLLLLLNMHRQQSKEKQETNCLKDSSLKKDQNSSVEEFSNIDSFVKTGHTQARGVELPVSPCSYPVQKVNFVIERDDQWEGYRHRIILEVWTNGSISPRQAIFDTVAWTIKLLYSFRDPTRFRGQSH